MLSLLLYDLVLLLFLFLVRSPYIILCEANIRFAYSRLSRKLLLFNLLFIL